MLRRGHELKLVYPQALAAPEAFEGRTGFIRSFARADTDVASPAASLGREWAILRVTFKPFPVCAFNQTPVTGALALREKLGGASLKSVRVRMNPYETGYAGMDARGPFNSVSGTLMSIPFCIATTLLYGVPDMRRMTTYDDKSVAALIDRVGLVTDPSVPVLSAIIEAETEDGRRHVHEQRMTTDDYAYDRRGVSALVRRIGREEAVPTAAFDRLERFVERLPNAALDDVLSSFGMLGQRQAA